MCMVLFWDQPYTERAPAFGVLVRRSPARVFRTQKSLYRTLGYLRDSRAGVLIRKESLSFLPIYLSSEALAYKLCNRSDFWLSFNEIKGEIKSLLQQP